MELSIIKEVCIENIKNIYGLGSMYLKKEKNLELKKLLNELFLVEDNIRISKELKELNNYKLLLEQTINKIEGIINE